jgi:hypothetical protein
MRRGHSSLFSSVLFLKPMTTITYWIPCLSFFMFNALHCNYFVKPPVHGTRVLKSINTFCCRLHVLAPHLVLLPTSIGKSSICLKEKKDYVRGREVAVADNLYTGGGWGGRGLKSYDTTKNKWSSLLDSNPCFRYACKLMKQ